MNMEKIKKLDKKKRIIIAAVVLAVLGFAAYKIFFSGSNKEAGTASEVTTVKAAIGNIVSGISASGQIETANYLSVTTSVNGIVKKVYVKEGDQVVKGQQIMEVTLDSEGEKSRISSYASYLRAKNSLENAKNSLYTLESAVIQKEEAFNDVKEDNSYQSHDERTEYKLAENDYITAKANYDSKKSDIAQLEVALTSAWLDYEAQLPVITAPSDGYIANIVAVEGTVISNSVSERSVATVASIKKEGTPIATLNVTEMDINSIKVGQKVLLTLNSISDKTFFGSVVGIDKVGTTASGVANYPVIVKFDESNDAILPNMSVEGQIVSEQKDSVLLIPSSAVTSKNKKKTVILETNGETKTVEIKTGITDGTYTEVLEGLNEGDVVQVAALPTSGFSSSSGEGSRGAGFAIMGGPGAR